MRMRSWKLRPALAVSAAALVAWGATCPAAAAAPMPRGAMATMHTLRQLPADPGSGPGSSRPAGFTEFGTLAASPDSARIGDRICAGSCEGSVNGTNGSDGGLCAGRCNGSANGGDGLDGTAGHDGTKGGDGGLCVGTCRNSVNGGNGGNGGHAVRGGNGGNGGAGGNAGRCFGLGCETGGRGGRGGAGGNGGDD
ncbi:hypothetical protein [Streptomyces cinerochromogenes]|uniref:hypothetical protein n=1 Tax=Streptomyces cinerochromogenes TaxID=66422 RepID=UPI0033A2EAC7